MTMSNDERIIRALHTQLRGKELLVEDQEKTIRVLRETVRDLRLRLSKYEPSVRVPGQRMSESTLPAEEHDDPLMTPGEIAKLFKVEPKTVARWAKAGKIEAVKTLGGHRRFRKSEVMKIYDREEIPQDEVDTPDD